MKPYYSDAAVSIYHADFREVVPALGLFFDLIVADPPYGQTSLDWDRWPNSWPDDARRVLAKSGSMWCFGSLKIFMRERGEFEGWTFAQDIVWEKHNGSGFQNDRFKRVHDQVVQFYRSDSAWGGYSTARLPHLTQPPGSYERNAARITWARSTSRRTSPSTAVPA